MELPAMSIIDNAIADAAIASLFQNIVKHCKTLTVPMTAVISTAIDVFNTHAFDCGVYKTPQMYNRVKNASSMNQIKKKANPCSISFKLTTNQSHKNHSVFKQTTYNHLFQRGITSVFLISNNSKTRSNFDKHLGKTINFLHYELAFNKKNNG